MANTINVASQSVLTYGAQCSLVQQAYFAPATTVPFPQPGGLTVIQPPTTLYAFIGKADPWPDDENPPLPQQDQKYQKDVLKNMIAAKKVNFKDINPIIRRVDWTANTTYDYYRDDVNMLEKGADGFLIKNFYVKNAFNQVWKCLWNANTSPSMIEPFFEPGTFTANSIFQGADSYKWKFMYSIDTDYVLKYMDRDWMPVPPPYQNPNPSATQAGYGNIEVVNVQHPGADYDLANDSFQIVIDGDGFGANAIYKLSSNQKGSLLDVIVLNAGTNYTYANAYVKSNTGGGAVLTAPVSPIAGHGYDPLVDLGCNHYMIVCSLDGTENGVIPISTTPYSNPSTYRQLGLLVNPTNGGIQASSLATANDYIVRTTTDLLLSTGTGFYKNGEIVYQSTDGTYANSYWTGVCYNFDFASHVMNVINNEGSLSTTGQVIGLETATVRALYDVTYPTFQPLSGYIAFLENRSPVSKTLDGIEQLRVVIGF